MRGSLKSLYQGWQRERTSRAENYGKTGSNLIRAPTYSLKVSGAMRQVCSLGDRMSTAGTPCLVMLTTIVKANGQVESYANNE